MDKLLKNISNLITVSLADFKRNKVRTALTSLGIMVGVLSVVLLIALGLGLKNYIEGQFESMGANLVMVMPGSGFGGQNGGFGQGVIGGATFDERDVASLSRIPELDYIVPVFMKATTVESGGIKKFGYLMGMSEDGFPLMNLEPEQGRVFKRSEVQSAAKVAVMGNTIAGDIFGDSGKAIGKTIRIQGLRLKVIGVAKKKGDPEADSAVFVPYRTTYASINPNKTFWGIYLGIKSEDNVSSAKQKIEEVLLRRYDEEDFSVTEQAELLESINQIFGIINSVLIAIGSISLFVGGIGIMNIMYATVTERTKEVGIRRSVGATQKDILVQFLTESVILSLFGGVLGLLLAGLIVFGIRFFFPASINLFSVIITLVISTGIGVFFGVFPARRAASLSPIEAIRYE
jgi:putative ABC transport system permease protein